MTTKTRQPRGITGVRLGYIPPGSDEWRKYMTASKIAAVMGHSPYESRFSLWHTMAGTVPPKPQTEEMSRGNLLEPAICAWWQDQHPDVKLYRTGMYRHPNIGFAAATPDRIIRYGTGEEPRLLEAKTANNAWEWGAEGTDEIPPYYYDQVIWQLGVTGLTTCHVAVLLSSLTFREYEVAFNADYFAEMVTEATEFMRQVRAGEKPSIDPLDGHMDTYRAVRYLHPDIEIETVEVPQSLAMQVQCAVIDKERNDKEMNALKSQLTELMGTAKDAEFNGVKVARRQAKGEGNPYIIIQPGLKRAELIIEEDTAA